MIKQDGIGIYTIICDNCKKRQVSGITPAATRQRAYQLGWTFECLKYKCPDCAEETLRRAYKKHNQIVF